MVKKVALILALLMVGFLIWMLLGPMQGVRVTINGHEMTGPIEGLVGVWGVMVAGVVLFCVALLLVFVFVGVGLVVVGTLALVGLILAAVTLPFFAAAVDSSFYCLAVLLYSSQNLRIKHRQ